MSLRYPPADRHRGHRRGGPGRSPTSPPTRRSQSFLYQRIDQQLEQSAIWARTSVNQAAGLLRSACAGPGQFVPGGGGPGGRAVRPRRRHPRQRGPGLRHRGADRLGQHRRRPELPGLRGRQGLSPRTPGHHHRLHRRRRTARRSTYFTAPSTKAGGPAFRVRASTLANGDVLIVAQPLGDTAAPSTSCSSSSWP